MFLFNASNLAFADDSGDWKTISIPEICSFQLPPNFESVNGSFEKNQEKFSDDLKNGRASMRFQLKNNSEDSEKEDFKIFITVEDKSKSPTRISINDPLPISQASIDDYHSRLQKGIPNIEKALSGDRKYKVISIKKPIIKRINGIDSLYVEQENKTDDNPNMLSSKYTFWNYDKEIDIGMDYQSKDSKKHEGTIKKFLESFKFFDRSKMNQEVPKDAIVIECSRMGSHLMLPVKLTGKKGSVDFLMLVDTGATIVSLPEAVYNKVQTKTSTKTRTFSTANGDIKSRISSLSVKAGNFEKTVEVAIMKKGSEGLLGLNFFEGYNFTLDMQRNKIYVWPKNKDNKLSDPRDIW